jgi:hypothetical protein
MITDVPENSKIQKNYQTLRFPYFLQANFPFTFISVLGFGAPAVGGALLLRSSSIEHGAQSNHHR